MRDALLGRVGGALLTLALVGFGGPERAHAQWYGYYSTGVAPAPLSAGALVVPNYSFLDFGVPPGFNYAFAGGGGFLGGNGNIYGGYADFDNFPGYGGYYLRGTPGFDGFSATTLAGPGGFATPALAPSTGLYTVPPIAPAPRIIRIRRGAGPLRRL